MARQGNGVRPGRLLARERKPYVRYSPELAVKLLRRLADGELLYVVCRSRGMPTPEAVAKWAKAKPDFADALTQARVAGGRPPGQRGPVWSFDEETADTIFERLCEGESFTAIGRDPTMPCLSTIFRWRRQIPEFDKAVQLAMEIRGERACDRAEELAEAATPETAYLTHVRLAHLRWMAGMMAPKVFRLKPSEPPAPREERTLLLRYFEVEIDPETGEKRVKAFCPNPISGQVEEETPDWRPPGDKWMVRMAGGGGYKHGTTPELIEKANRWRPPGHDE